MNRRLFLRVISIGAAVTAAAPATFAAIEIPPSPLAPLSTMGFRFEEVVKVTALIAKGFGDAATAHARLMQELVRIQDQCANQGCAVIPEGATLRVIQNNRP